MTSSSVSLHILQEPMYDFFSLSHTRTHIYTRTHTHTNTHTHENTRTNTHANTHTRTYAHEHKAPSGVIILTTSKSHPSYPATSHVTEEEPPTKFPVMPPTVQDGDRL